MIDLRVWPNQVADGNENSVTPGKGPKGNRMYRLTKVPTECDCTYFLY
jgi:hypothetical protein